MLHFNRLKGASLALLLLSLVACKNSPYSVVFNNNILYTPSRALRENVVIDPELQGCINNVLNSATDLGVEDITLLACTAADVQTLEGIGALSSLEQLELSNNDIDNLSPLSNLRDLRVLSIRNNMISNIGTLRNLPLLRFVQLQGNEGIPCHQLDELEEKLGNTLGRPQTCVE